MAGTAARDQANWDQFRALSPLARAGSNFLDTIGLAGNAATFGLGGGVVDLLSGTPWGTTAHDARVRTNGSGPVPVGAIAEGLGTVGGGMGAWKLARGGLGMARAALPAVPLGTVAKAAAIPAGVTGLALLANNGGEAAPAVATVPASTPVAPVAQALAQGRDAPATDFITPRDRLSAYIDTLLTKGASINQVRALAPAVENTPRPQTTKNAVLGQTAQLSQQIFASQISGLEKQLAAGAITEAQAKAAVQKATEARFQRDAGLAGLDPARLAQAQLLGGQDEEE